MEQPSSSSCTVRVAKMPAAFLRPPSARDELSAAATQFGGADKVAVLHSKRCALLELPSAEAAAAMVAHHAAQPLVLGGKPAVVSVRYQSKGKACRPCYHVGCGSAASGLDSSRAATESTVASPLRRWFMTREALADVGRHNRVLVHLNGRNVPFTVALL